MKSWRDDVIANKVISIVTIYTSFGYHSTEIVIGGSIEQFTKQNIKVQKVIDNSSHWFTVQPLPCGVSNYHNNCCS